MITTKVVTATCFLAMVLDRVSIVSAFPSPGPPKKKLIIYTPVKFKVVHHHKIEEVPIIIKKHLHYDLNEREAKIKHYNHYHYTFENYGFEDDHHLHDYHHHQHEQHHQEEDFEDHDHDHDHDHDENDGHYFTEPQNHDSEEDSTPLKAFYAYKSHPSFKGFVNNLKTGGSSSSSSSSNTGGYHGFVQHGQNDDSHHYTWKDETTFGDHNYKVHDDYDEYESTNEDAGENESFNYDYE